jgi:hypothetical protein
MEWRPHFLLLFLNPHLADSLGTPVRRIAEFLCKPGGLRQSLFDPFYDRRDLPHF